MKKKNGNKSEKNICITYKKRKIEHRLEHGI